MFYEALSFNQPLQKWNTSRVVHMNMVFFSAGRFDQDISTWDVFAMPEGGPVTGTTLGSSFR